jgi:hypothetical protein
VHDRIFVALVPTECALPCAWTAFSPVSKYSLFSDSILGKVLAVISTVSIVKGITR